MTQFMPEKRSPPLKNPPLEKSSNSTSGIKKNLINRYQKKREIEKGDSKGGKGRVQTCEAIVVCQMCGRRQKIVFAYGKPPEWHKCIWCAQIQPMDGYRVMAYGLGLPTPLAPHEVKAREAELQALHGG